MGGVNPRCTSRSYPAMA